MRIRRAKLTGQTATYHVITRTVAGQPLFGPTEKEVFRKMIHKLAAFCCVDVLTYCIMSNHVHLLIRVPPPRTLSETELMSQVSLLYGNAKAREFEAQLKLATPQQRDQELANLRRRMFDLSSFVKELKQRFSIWYNKTHGRFGTLWAERFKSCLIEGKRFSLETVAAYIDLNPVRAGLVEDPKDYRFSCYGEACGGAAASRRAICSLLGIGTWRQAAAEYRMTLYGKGSGAAALGQGLIIPDQSMRQVMAERGELRLPALLRCRVRYFSDGMVLGSRLFVDEFFQKNRHLFGAKRQSGPRRATGLTAMGLMVARDLRRRPIG